MKSSIIAAAVTLAMAADTTTSTGGSAAKKPTICKKLWDPDEFGTVVRFEFADGTVEEIDYNDLSDNMKLHCGLHGISQKGGDSYAGVKGDVGEAITNLRAIKAQLLSDEWSGDREGGGPRLAELAEAIARIKGVPVERARAAVEKATKEERDGWRSNAKVKHAVATLRAEKAAANLEKAGDQEVNIQL